MGPQRAVAALSALAHEHRLAAYRALVEAGPEGLSAGVIAGRVNLSPSSLTFHLQSLERARLVSHKRVSRHIIYAADFSAMNALVGFLTENCCSSGSSGLCIPTKQTAAEKPMTDRRYNVLFLCTGNSARSILAEALMNHWSSGRFRAFSAGSHPKGAVHPIAIELLEQLKLPTASLRSKSWDEFERTDALRMDFVFTVCDAAGEACPAWPGHPVTAHWGVEDPAAVEGGEAEKWLAFRKAFRELENRIKTFADLPFASLDRAALQQRVRQIGQLRTEGKE